MKTAPKGGKSAIALDSILGFNTQDCRVEVFFASVPKRGPVEFQRLILSKELGEDMKNIATTYLAELEAAYEIDEFLIRDYDPQTMLDKHEIEFLDLGEYKSISLQVPELDEQARLTYFAFDETFLSNLRFYVIVLRPQQGIPILFFRAYNRKKELARSKYFGLIFRSGQFDRFEERMFLFDNKVDCFLMSNGLFIVNKVNFQRIFQFYELVREAAREILRVIKKNIPIDDFPAFEAACEKNLLKLAKLKNIATKPYLKQLNIQVLKKVIRQFDLKIEIVVKGKDEMLKYDTSDAWGILRLLDDDYLKSTMTGSMYEANSKRTVST